MKPTIGRIVHYFDPEGDGPNAALIIKVHSDVCVDLRVFPQNGGMVRFTSVVNIEGDEGGRWDWPERV